MRERFRTRRACWLAASVVAVAALDAAAQSTGAVPGSSRWFFAAVPGEPPADLQSPAGQNYLQTLPALGREDLLAALPGRRAGAECEPRLSPGGTVVEQLAELARSTSVVIVNEAHDEPRHRELVRQLAAALRGQGFTHFAAETFSPSVAAHPDEPFGRMDAGYYTMEPGFGALLRTVKEAGYTLVAYEHAPPPGATGAAAIAAREEGQASNLVSRIFSAAPRAKVLIHAGHAHAAETPLPSFGRDIPWMAARLKQKTGIDPLTIDQTFCASQTGGTQVTAPTREMPPGAFDVAVAHPELAFFRGRPQWRIDSGAIAIELPETLVTAEQRTIVEARYEDEPPDTIPLDRLLLRPGERLPLLLPPGRIRLVQIFENGAAPRALTLNVR